MYIYIYIYITDLSLHLQFLGNVYIFLLILKFISCVIWNGNSRCLFIHLYYFIYSIDLFLYINKKHSLTSLCALFQIACDFQTDTSRNAQIAPFVFWARVVCHCTYNHVGHNITHTQHIPWNQFAHLLAFCACHRPTSHPHHHWSQPTQHTVLVHFCQ